MSKQLARVPSPIAAFRHARDELQSTGTRAPAPTRGPALTPPVAVSTAQVSADAAAWSTAVTTLMTAVAGIAAVELVAKKDPAYAKIASTATSTAADSVEIAATIDADASEVASQFPG